MSSGRALVRPKGDGPKVTESNLRFAAVVFCGNLRFPAVSCALQVLEFLGEGGVNLRNSAVSAKLCVLGALCHLSSVTLSAP